MRREVGLLKDWIEMLRNQTRGSERLIALGQAEVTRKVQTKLTNIQIKLMNVQVTESRKAIEQAETVRHLTVLAFIFIPTSTVCGFFGMYVKQLQNVEMSLFWVSGLVVVILVLILAMGGSLTFLLVGYLLSAHESISRWLIGHHKPQCRQARPMWSWLDKAYLKVSLPTLRVVAFAIRDVQLGSKFLSRLTDDGRKYMDQHQISTGLIFGRERVDTKPQIRYGVIGRLLKGINTIITKHVFQPQSEPDLEDLSTSNENQEPRLEHPDIPIHSDHSDTLKQ